MCAGSWSRQARLAETSLATAFLPSSERSYEKSRKGALFKGLNYGTVSLVQGYRNVP